MSSQSGRDSWPDVTGGRIDGIRRRSLLQAAGATVLSAALAGCLSRTVEAEAVPLGLPPAVVREAGYESEPQTEEYTVERERNVGPATVETRITNAIVEYVYSGTDETAQLAYGGGNGEQGDSEPGVLSLTSTPQVQRAGQNFNSLTESDLSDLATNFAPLIERVCNCTVGDTEQITVERAPDPTETTARPNGNTLYLGPADGGSEWSPPTDATFLGEDISEENLATLYFATSQNGTVTSNYVVGTRQFVGHETPGGDRQFGIALYTGERDNPDLPPDEPAPLLGPDGLFRTEDVRAFNERFEVVLRAPVNVGGETV